jgi:hypothetical protein
MASLTLLMMDSGEILVTFCPILKTFLRLTSAVTLATWLGQCNLISTLSLSRMLDTYPGAFRAVLSR